VVSEWEGGLQKLRVIDMKTRKSHRIQFPEPVYAASITVNREFNTPVVRYNYQSLVTPSSVLDYNMNTQQSTLLKETEVPGGFDRKNYVSERLFASAADGTKIPLSVVYRKGTKLDGTAPLLLYGYGSYGASMAPTFSSNRLNMRPDLFKAVVAQVPFVDVLNTMLDASLPLTTSEYIEWGNPNEKDAYMYMKKYSPYDNVGKKNYPSMLVKVSLNDSQVPYWEGAKLVAKLRNMKTDSNPLLLKVNMGAGHGGSSGRYDYLHEVAFDYAYMLWQMGIAE
jgi:protease II